MAPDLAKKQLPTTNDLAYFGNTVSGGEKSFMRLILGERKEERDIGWKKFWAGFQLP
jgi:hypothetical protein